MSYLSKAFDTFKKTPRTLKPSSNDLHISWVIASNWLTQKLPDLNPDSFGVIKLFSVKDVDISLEMIILLQIDSKEISL